MHLNQEVSRCHGCYSFQEIPERSAYETIFKRKQALQVSTIMANEPLSGSQLAKPKEV